MWIFFKIMAIMILMTAPIPSSISAAEKERLPDMNKILTAYNCMEKKRYNYGAYVVTKVSLLGDTEDFSSIEGMKDLLDTPEEFITASFYDNVPVVNEAREIIENELPRGKIGALRLTSIWLKKSAENRENYGKYRIAITIIKKKSELSDGEIQNYYNKAMENEIKKIAMENTGALYTQKIIYNEIMLPVLKYYTEPDTRNEWNLINAGVKLFNDNRSKADGFINTLIKLNDTFAEKIINKIHTIRSRK
jgi:hypothetical protein